MRFGLGFTLMHDGFFAHELGDSWHGQDWVYDETNFKLGRPTSNATLVQIVDPHPSHVLPRIPLTQQWSLYVRPDSGNGTWLLDDSRPPIPTAPQSVLIVIETQAHRSDGIDLSQNVRLPDLRYTGYLPRTVNYARVSLPNHSIRALAGAGALRGRSIST